MGGILSSGSRRDAFTNDLRAPSIASTTDGDDYGRRRHRMCFCFCPVPPTTTSSGAFSTVSAPPPPSLPPPSSYNDDDDDSDIFGTPIPDTPDPVRRMRDAAAMGISSSRYGGLEKEASSAAEMTPSNGSCTTTTALPSAEIHDGPVSSFFFFVSALTCRFSFSVWMGGVGWGVCVGGGDLRFSSTPITREIVPLQFFQCHPPIHRRHHPATPLEQCHARTKNDFITPLKSLHDAYIFTPSRARTHTHTQDAESRLYRKYEMCEVLGVGSTSTCHRCVELDTGISRACKIVDKSEIDPSCHSMMDQFLTEIKTLRSLRHPNIIELYDVYITDDRIYIIMELMSGGELFDYVVQKGTLTEEEASRIVRKVTSALVYMHSKNVIHRDMKPENLLLAHKPRSSHDIEVKIIDFGLSKVRYAKRICEEREKKKKTRTMDTFTSFRFGM
jgi:hypothetical protein